MDEINENLTEDKIDALVIEQADNDEAWEEAIFVSRKAAEVDELLSSK